MGVGGEFVGCVDVGGEDGGEGEVFDEVLFAILEGAHGNVAGGAIEREDNLLDFVIVELLANRLDQPLVKLLANLLEFFWITIGGAEFFLKLTDFFGEVFARDGDFLAVEDDARFSRLAPPDEPEFVV